MVLDRIKLFIRNRNFVPVALFIVMDLLMFSFFGYLAYRTYQLYSEVQAQKVTLEAERGTANLVKSNVSTLSSSIEEYNGALDRLIPDEESYFSVIAAFEQLGARTGIAIDSYSINLNQTTEEKLSLDLSITADPEGVLRLIRDYNYISGRLLTNENVEITYGSNSAINFSVNLIHAKFQSTAGGVTITPEDIAFMDAIIEKM